MTSDLGRYYVQHYFNLANFGKYLIVAIIGLAAVMAVMLTIAWQQRQATERSIREHFSYDREAYAHDVRYRESVNSRIYSRRRAAAHRGISIIESFYELVFSSTSILLFLSLYNIVDWHMPQVWAVWDKYKDLILVIFLMFSVLFANILDRFLVQLPHLSDEDKGALRLVSNLYIILILLYTSTSSACHWAGSSTLTFRGRILQKRFPACCPSFQSCCSFWPTRRSCAGTDSGWTFC